MRTKTLLIAAAALAAGIASSVAQSNVYSLNVVGYVNKTLTGGGRYTAVANPLNSTNNTVSGLGLLALPNSSKILKWNTGITDFDIYNKTSFGVWSPNPAAVTVNPGEGILIYISGADVTNTFVGEVLQGSLTNSLPTGYQMVGNKVPDAGVINTLGLVPPNSSKVYKFNSSLGTVGDWDIYNKTSFGVWSPSQPSLDVAESILTFLPSSYDWVRNFTVQ